MAYGSVAVRRGRVNGCSPPYTPRQLLFLFSNSASFVVFYFSVFLFVLRDFSQIGGFQPLQHAAVCRALIATHATVAAIGFLCWCFVELHDPSVPSVFGSCLPSTKKWTDAKYVSEHGKRIEGLDHYCQWLNVAIARANYIPFFILTTCGLIQCVVQAAVGALSMTLWRDQMIVRTSTPVDPEALTYQVLCLTSVGAAVGIGTSYFLLFCFHIHLLSTGESTYSYIIKQRIRMRALEREALTNVEQPSYSSTGESVVNLDIELPQSNGHAEDTEGSYLVTGAGTGTDQGFTQGGA